MKGMQKSAGALLMVLILGLGACGGGSGSSDPSPSPQPQPQPTQNINGELKGLLFIEEDGKYLDLSTGKYRQIASDHRYVTTTPSYDGKEYVVTVKDVTLKGNAPYNWWTNTVSIRDIQSGRITNTFEVSETFTVAARLSHDRSVVAAVWRNEVNGDDFDDERLTIFSRDGEVLSRSDQKEVGSFDWLPDGRLLYTVKGQFYLTPNQHSASGGHLIATLDSVPGSPWRFKVSPDGKEVIIEMVTKAPSWLETVTYRNATIWRMNMDGSNLRQFATTTADEPRLNNPLWSLDGEKVVVTEGFFSGVMITPDYEWTNPGEYIILPGPSSGLTFIVPADQQSTITLPPTNKGERVSALHDVEYGKVKAFWNSIRDHCTLAPKIDTPPETRGSLINTLHGTLYFLDEDTSEDKTAIKRLDLASGTLTDVAVVSNSDTDYFYDRIAVSADGEYFAYYHYDIDNNDNRIKFYDKSGQLVSNGYVMVSGSYDYSLLSAPVFSPVNSDLVMFYVEDNNDDDRLMTIALNWKTGKFIIKVPEGRIPMWTPEGDILMNANRTSKFFLAKYNGANFEPERLAFEIPVKDRIFYPSLSNDGNKMVFQMARHIWSYDVQSNKLNQVTTFSAEGRELYPAWSPGDSHIMLKMIEGDVGFGRLWVVAADAENINLDNAPATDNAIPVKANDKHLRQIYGPFYWQP